MTQQELDALQGLCDGATGINGDKWDFDEGNLAIYFSTGYIGTRQPIAEMRGMEWLMDLSGGPFEEVLAQLRANGRFIAASRTAMPALIAEVQKLRAWIDQNAVFMAAHGIYAFEATKEDKQ